MSEVEPPVAVTRAARSSEADYRRLFDLSLDLLCVAGLDGYFRRVNPAWTRVMGWSETELLARPVADFMHPDDRERTLEARANLAKGVLVRGLENRYLCKDGTFRWLSWQSSVQLEDGTVFAVARDITERRQRDNEQLIFSKLESTGILAGGIAHDYNNLLGGLLLSLDMVALSGSLNDHQRENLRQAQEAVHAAEALTQQLLTFAQGGAAVRRICDLKLLLRQSAELALGGGGKVRLTCDLEPDLWACNIDENQIGQVIRNLVLNAGEAMPRGGNLRLEARNVVADGATAAAGQSGDCIRITVTDDGVGIPAEILPKIFDPYFSTKPRGAQKGMGLGLTICRSVIQRHGGTIDVESQIGNGTKVIIRLPAARQTPEIRPATPPPAASSSGPRRVLVMDDEALFRDVVAQALGQYGYDVAAVANGNEAIATFHQGEKDGRPFDVVVLDLTVRGGMGGAETMKTLLGIRPALKGVLMTGYTMEETLRDFARHGFSAALSKPFSAEALRVTLAGLLNGTQRPA